MAIPTYEEIYEPILKILNSGQEISITEITKRIADEYQLSEGERRELLQSGRQTKIRSRVGWSRSYLKQAGLIEYPKRGMTRITKRGRQFLKSNPGNISNKTLEQFSEFRDFRKRSNVKEKPGLESPESTKTPMEEFEESYSFIREELASNLLSILKSCSPDFFERLVVDLLVKMGYGGTLRDAGQAIGQSGDGGIDGIIKEDRLGLDIIYIQAKKWEGKVSRPEIQKFAGALQGQRAKKGIFITTSEYTKEAISYTKNIDSKIILIDGQQLAGYMIDFNISLVLIF